MLDILFRYYSICFTRNNWKFQDFSEYLSHPWIIPLWAYLSSSKSHGWVHHMNPAVFFQEKMELFLKSILLFSNGNCFPSSSKNCKVENDVQSFLYFDLLSFAVLPNSSSADNLLDLLIIQNVVNWCLHTVV